MATYAARPYWAILTILTGAMATWALATPMIAPGAGGPAPAPQLPAVSQYIEAVPTSAGAVATGSKGRRPLPKALARQIDTQGEGQAAALKTIVTSAAYGAPQQPLMAPKAPTPRAQPTQTRRSPLAHTARGVTSERPVPALSTAQLSSAAGTLTTGRSSTVTLLVIVLVGITLIGGGVAIHRQWRRDAPADSL